MSDALLWMMGLPITIGLVLWYFTKDQVDNAWMAPLVNVVVGALILCVAFYGAKGAATADTEIWNGAITEKSREHGTYEKPYDCRCRSEQSCSGSGNNRSCTSRQVCDTCYETRYTVKWDCQSTIGSYRIDSADQSSRRVYDLPNPSRWTSINVGDPVAKTSRYTNYVQAVPETLFKPSSEALKAKFAGITPEYPMGVYDFYRLDRFLSPGHSVADAAAWNSDISKALSELGPRKQVNAIVVVAKTSDPNYEYALRDAWEGANKNDVVLVIGSAEWPKIDFVRVISWTKSELFKVQLRDRVQELETIQRDKVMAALQEQISQNFQRRKMEEFKYLEAEINPPTWLMVTVTTLLLLGGLVTYVSLTDMINRFSFRRWRRRWAKR